MRITIFPLTFFLSALIFLGSCGSVFAYDDDIGKSRIDPTSPIYFLKTVREDLEWRLALTPRVKLIRNLEFATRRLREAKTLIPTKRQDLIEPTLERYWFYISRLPDKDLKDQELITNIKQSLTIHLTTLLKMYSQDLNLRPKMAIRSVLNRLIGRLDIPDYARLPVCNLFAKEASSSALNQTEQMVLRERALICQNKILKLP